MLLCILLCRWVLRLESGLFIRNSCGLCIIVWVIVICWCWLLESFVGLWLSSVFSCSICVILFICGCQLFFFFLCIFMLKVMLLCIDRWGNRVQFWKIIVKLCLCGVVVVMFLLCSQICFLLIGFSLVSRCSRVFFLQFDGLISIMNLFL